MKGLGLKLTVNQPLQVYLRGPKHEVSHTLLFTPQQGLSTHAIRHTDGHAL